jgi:hypothetical protein
MLGVAKGSLWAVRWSAYGTAEIHAHSLAKNCAAGFEISRSICRRPFSFNGGQLSSTKPPSPAGPIFGWIDNLAARH